MVINLKSSFNENLFGKESIVLNILMTYYALVFDDTLMLNLKNICETFVAC